MENGHDFGKTFPGGDGSLRRCTALARHRDGRGQRSRLFRFTYPTDAEARVQIDLGRRIGQLGRWLRFSEQSVKVVSDRAIEGWMKCPHTDGGWGRGGGRVSYTLHFHAEFSHPFVTHGVWEHDAHNRVFWATFGKLAEPLLVSAALSFDSVAEARSSSVRRARTAGVRAYRRRG